MRRRAFLKSIAAACGAAVVCPGELVKKKKHPGVDKIPPWVLIKGSHDEYIKYYGKHGQHCCCNSCVNDIPCGIPYWCGTQQHFMGRASGYIVMRSA